MLFFVAHPVLIKVVSDVRGEVDGEPDGHDQVDHGDGVQRDAPQSHEADHPGLGGEDGEGDGRRRPPGGDQAQGDLW